MRVFVAEEHLVFHWNHNIIWWYMVTAKFVSLINIYYFVGKYGFYPYYVVVIMMSSSWKAAQSCPYLLTSDKSVTCISLGKKSKRRQSFHLIWCTCSRPVYSLYPTAEATVRLSQHWANLSMAYWGCYTNQRKALIQSEPCNWGYSYTFKLHS